MKFHEEIFIKISDDFHEDINQIILEMDPDPHIKINTWFIEPNIEGKFNLITNLLLSLKGSEVPVSSLLSFKNLLVYYSSKLQEYYNRREIATGFIFYSDNDITLVEKYFSKISKYINTSTFSNHPVFLYYAGIYIGGFPKECSFKFVGIIENGKISVRLKDYPSTEIEAAKGALLGTGLYNDTVKKERKVFEDELRHKYPDLIISVKRDIKLSFKKFCESMPQRDELLMQFNNAINNLDRLIQRSTNAPLISINQLEPLYNALIDTACFKVTIDEFIDKLKPSPSPKKILWLQSGAWLKYVIDKIFIIGKIQGKKNKWASLRFEIPDIKTDLANHLSKQTSKNGYYHFNSENEKVYKILKNLVEKRQKW